ncbi:hypothetical protein PIB30_047319 [Stylosanthes scabra]|uniref:Uncharacterized protein n=1 Tax=Stylosanthes scabra TaxID=79078 RepID=A0ABU6QGA3_9FABA|nr:hypothetical protein [Stylosanthes scabra]
MDSIKRHSVSSSQSSDSLDSDDREEHCVFERNYDTHMYDSPVWSFTGNSTTQSPLHCTMEGDYDPNRIPASVFAKSNPNEQWSVASNESLFSIRLGNGSFITRDISFAYNNNNKAGEPSMQPLPLPPLQELSSENNNNRHSVSSDSSDGSVILGLGKNEHKNDEKSRKVETTVIEKTNKMDHHGKEVNINVPSSASYQSIESGCSFQFPILTNDGGRASSATVESEKKESSEMHEKTKNQQQQPRPENPSSPPLPLPEAKKAPKKDGRRYCCFCFPCF